MSDDNVVISFNERLEEKKRQAKDRQEITNNSEERLSNEEVASNLLNELEDEIKRQKENVEIWHDTFVDLFDDCESISDLINYAQALSLYSTNILDNIIDSESSDDYINSMVALSFQENNRPILDLGYKLEKLINKEKE